MPRYDNPKLLIKSKEQIEKKLVELEDRYLYLQRLTNSLWHADELKLKAEALRWVLGKKETL